MSAQKGKFTLKSTFLSGFTLLSAFLSAQKNAQGPSEPFCTTTYVDESTPFRKENDLELYLIDETLGPVLRMHSQLKV